MQKTGSIKFLESFSFPAPVNPANVITSYSIHYTKLYEVFNMKYFEEMKYEEMSEVLGTSVGALKASYHHAVKKIEKFMEED